MSSLLEKIRCAGPADLVIRAVGDALMCVAFRGPLVLRVAVTSSSPVAMSTRLIVRLKIARAA